MGEEPRHSLIGSPAQQEQGSQVLQTHGLLGLQENKMGCGSPVTRGQEVCLSKHSTFWAHLVQSIDLGLSLNWIVC